MTGQRNDWFARLSRSAVFVSKFVFPLWGVWMIWSTTPDGANAQGTDLYRGPRERLVRERIETAGVRDSRVLDAIRTTPRHEFVPLSEVRRAYYDMALPIGESQTISSPFIVATMTEALEPQPEDRVLEIGTGSGYQAAVLSPLVAEVYTIEIVRPLGEQAERTLRRLDYENVHVRVGDGFAGWPEAAPFDKIIVTCSPETVPKPLVDQLKVGGLIVVPVGQRYQQTLYRMVKKADGTLERESLRPTLFVPMTGTAEDGRQQQPDGGHPSIINAELVRQSDAANPTPSPSTIIAAEDPEDGFGEDEIEGWYYGRQVRWAENTMPGDGQPNDGWCVRFHNQTPGLSSHLLQGLALDGSRVQTIRLGAELRVQSVRSGPSPDQLPAVALTLYDRDRNDLGTEVIGPFRGTRSWREVSRLIRVPAETTEAIVRIGLFGATGTADFDWVRLDVQSRRGRPATSP